MKFDTTIFIPLLTLILGTFLGLLSNFLLKNIEIVNSLRTKILSDYLTVRGELCKELSILAALRVTDSLGEQFFQEFRQKLVAQYYQFYDFLPAEVASEINCLFVCLSDKANRLFKISNSKITAINDAELGDFVANISITENTKYAALMNLRSKNTSIRRNASASYQARAVLQSVNRYFTTKHLISILKYLNKRKLIK
jgi:hypothetical protein